MQPTNIQQLKRNAVEKKASNYVCNRFCSPCAAHQTLPWVMF